MLVCFWVGLMGWEGGYVFTGVEFGFGMFFEGLEIWDLGRGRGGWGY